MLKKKENVKRRSERLPGRFKVAVREKLATWTTVTENVSERGLRLQMTRPLVPGMLVQLAFDMGPGEEPLVAHAQVAWVKRTVPECAGLALLSLPREAKRVQPGDWIDRLLRAHARRLADPRRRLAREGEAIMLPPVA